MRRSGLLARTWRRLRRPSARWSVLALVVLGAVIGFVATAGTQVMVAATGTDAFCGGSCHSMQWVAQEHRESVHGASATGVHAGCHDCHIPRSYPYVLWYKAKAGTRDVIAELRGVISTEEAFRQRRGHMAEQVWAEYKQNDSRACRDCHQFSTADVAKQREAAKAMHQQALAGTATCIDCHKGVAHKLPEGVAAVAGARAPKPHHVKAGLACATCHGNAGSVEPPPTAICQQCHDRPKLIKATERLNREVEEKSPLTGKVERVVKDLNPHSGHHDRGTLDCAECHREHGKSVNLCAQCHDIERWMKPTP